MSNIVNRWPSAVQAAFWMLIIGTLVTFTLVFSRKISDEIHVLEIMFFRSLFALMVMAPWVARRGIDSITIKRPGIVMLRGGLAFIGGSCLYAAAALLPLAEVTAITFTRPIFASIAAALFLNEIIRFRRWTAIMLGLTGALIIIRPGFADVNVGVALTFVSVFTLTWNSVNLKLLTRINPPDTVAIWHVIVMLPLGLIACLFVWTTPTWEQLGWLAAIGVFEMLTQRSMSRGYAAADLTVVTGFSFLRLPVAALLGFVLFDEIPVSWVWLGSAIIAGSAIYIAHRESRAQRLGQT